MFYTNITVSKYKQYRAFAIKETALGVVYNKIPIIQQVIDKYNIKYPKNTDNLNSEIPTTDTIREIANLVGYRTQLISLSKAFNSHTGKWKISDWKDMQIMMNELESSIEISIARVESILLE